MEKVSEVITKIEKYIIYFVIGIFAVFVLSNLTSPAILPKEILLVVGASLVLILWAARSIIKGSISFSIGKFDIGVALLGLAYLVSALLRTPNRAEAFFYPGAVTFVLVSIIFYLLVNQLNKKGKDGVSIALLVSGLLLSISILFTQLGLFSKIPQLPAFLKATDFNPLGGMLPSAIYLVTLIPIGIVMLVREKDLVKRLILAVGGAIVVIGLVISIANLLPGKPQFPTFL